MSLKKAHVSFIFDGDQPIFTEQSVFLGSAIIRALKQLTLLDVTTKELASKRSSKSGRTNIKKHLITVPKGASAGEALANGSAIGLALITPDFKILVDKVIKELQGSDSVLLEVDVALSQAIIQKAPGLIIGVPPTPPIIPLSFQFGSSTGTGLSFFSVKPLADIPVDATAEITYIETALTAISGDKTRVQTQASFTPPRGVNTLIGDWSLVSSLTATDGQPTPVTSVFDFKATEVPLLAELKQDTVALPITSSVPGFQDATLISQFSLIQFEPAGDFMIHNTIIFDGINGAFEFVQFIDEPTVVFKDIINISRTLTIVNTSGALILAGTQLATLRRLDTAIEETF